jgi:NitT/TauT family transport system permease protein
MFHAERSSFTSPLDYEKQRIGIRNSAGRNVRGAPKNSYRSPRLRVIYWAGAGIFSVTIVTFIISLAPILANATEGLVRVDESLIYPFLKYKGTPAQILFRLRLPNALPNLLPGIRISAGISVLGGIAGALFAGPTRVGEGGLGYAIIYASNQMETAYLFAQVVAAMALGFSYFFIVMFFEWLALHHWHESCQSQTAE